MCGVRCASATDIALARAGEELVAVVLAGDAVPRAEEETAERGVALHIPLLRRAVLGDHADLVQRDVVERVGDAVVDVALAAVVEGGDLVGAVALADLLVPGRNRSSQPGGSSG